MPRRSVVVEDDDDAVPLSDLVRTGEASRLRRRGAMRATAPRRDDEDDVSFIPFPRGIKGEDSYLELECGARSGECWFTPAGPSRPSPLPRSPSLREPSDVGIVFKSTGCGTIVSTRALPSSIAAKHVYVSTEPIASDITHLHHKYLEPEQRALAEALTKDVPMYQCDWEAIGCRVCGNALGLLYAGCHPRHGNLDPTYVFFPSAVTPSPEFTFPPAQQPESDDMSVDSPTHSPRVTRYFRSDDEFWPNEMNPPLWGPYRGSTPTPPRSPPTAPTPLAYATWQALNPPASAAQTQPPDSRTTTDSLRHRESTHTGPVREPFNDWRSFFRSVSPRRTERPPPQNSNDTTNSEELLPYLPSDVGTTLLHEHRDRAALERPSVSRTDSRETNSRPLEPPSLHRVVRRAMPPAMRRSTSLLDWSSRGRHIAPSDGNSSWGVQGSDERFSRRVPSSRRIPMPLPAPVPPQPHAPVPTFTLLDALGERSYPPSVRSSLDVRDTLSVSMEVETEGAAIAHRLMQEHENESPAERSWNHDPDGETEEVGGDDNEEKEDDLDERRAERTPRNDIVRAEVRSSNLRGLVSR